MEDWRVSADMQPSKEKRNSHTSDYESKDKDYNSCQDSGSSKHNSIKNSANEDPGSKPRSMTENNGKSGRHAAGGTARQDCLSAIMEQSNEEAS